MSNQQPAHRAEVSPLEELSMMLQAGVPGGQHRVDDIAETGEHTAGNTRSPGRLRAVGAGVRDRLTPPWSRGEAAVVLGVVAGYAVFAGGVTFVHNHPMNETEEIGLPAHNYVHLKKAHPGDNLVSLIDRYGRAHHSPWIVHHSYTIADSVVTESGATAKSDGKYQKLITSPYVELAPGEKVRVVRSMLEKPASLNGNNRPSSAP